MTAEVTLADPVPRNTFSGDPDWVYCRADVCRLFLVWSDSDGVTQVLSSPPLDFTGSPATITVSPSSDLLDVQDVTAQGTAFGAEGRSFRLVEEACFRIIQARECHGDSVIGSGVVHKRWDMVEARPCVEVARRWQRLHVLDDPVPVGSRAVPGDDRHPGRERRSGQTTASGSHASGSSTPSCRSVGPHEFQEVTDEGIAPPAPWAFLSPPKRFDVAWGFPQTNTTWHQVVDASGLGLFDSGAIDQAARYTARLFAAATYRVLDPTTGARASVPVPVRLVPAAGSTSASFAIVWASETAPAGTVYDVRILRPGSTTFVSWRTGMSVPSRVLHIGPGAGRLRVRGEAA